MDYRRQRQRCIRDRCDAFGLPIFDLSVAKAAYLRAREMGLGTSLPW